MILTVRDNDQIWWKSLSSFMIAAAQFWSNPGYYIFNKMNDAKFGGAKQNRWQSIGETTHTPTHCPTTLYLRDIPTVTNMINKTCIQRISV